MSSSTVYSVESSLFYSGSWVGVMLDVMVGVMNGVGFAGVTVYFCSPALSLSAHWYWPSAIGHEQSSGLSSCFDSIQM